MNDSGIYCSPMAIHDREEQFEQDEAIRAESMALLVWMSDLLEEVAEREAHNDGNPQELVDKWMVGRYRIEALLGRGGSSAVFRALDMHSGENVALKLSSLGVVTDPDWTRRFVEEAEIVKELVHPGIVSVRGFGKFGLAHFIAYDFVDGPTLAQWAARQQPVRPEMAARIIRSVAGTVHFAHQRRIIHRDLKPSNILLASRAEQDELPFWTKVTDFGLARRPRALEVSLVTGQSVIIGTDPYLSPEQAAGNAMAVTPASDVFSMGVILYELLTGRRPFEGEDGAKTREMIRTDDPPPLRKLRSDIPRNLETIVLKCLEKVPERRYETAQDLADDVGHFLEHRRIRARRPSLTRRGWKQAKRRPLLASLGITLVLGAIVFAGLIGAWTFDRDFAAKQLATAEAATHSAEEVERAHLYSSRIRQAAEALRRGNRKEMLSVLEESRSIVREPARCGIEWDWLRTQADTAEHTLAAHPSGVCAVRFSPRGDLLASGGKDGRVILWETGTWKKSKELDCSNSDVTAVEFSADGSMLSVGGEDGRLVVYSMPDAISVFDEPIIKGRIFDLVWVGESQQIAVGGEGATLHVVDPVNRTHRRKDLAISAESRVIGVTHPEEICALTCIHNRQAIGVFLTPRTTYFLDPESLEILTPCLAEDPFVGCICDIPLEPGYLATTNGSRGGIDIWSTRDGLKVASAAFPGHVQDLSYSTATRDLAVAYRDGAIQTCSIDLLLRGRESLGWPVCAHADRAATLDYSPDGAWLASGGWDGEIKLWNGRSMHRQLDVPLPAAPVAMAFSPSGELFAIVCASPDGSARLGVFDIGSASCLWSTGLGTLPYEEAVLYARRVCAFAPSSDEIAVADDTEIHRFSAHTGEFKQSHELSSVGAATEVSYALNGESLIARGPYVESIELDRHGSSVRLLGNSLGAFRTLRGDVVLEMEPSRQLVLRATNSGVPMLRLTGISERIGLATVSPNGRYVAAGGHDGVVYYWDLKDPDHLRKCVGHQGGILELAFSPDGGSLLSLSVDRTVRIWHIATSAELLRLGSPSEGVVSMAISPNGALLVLGLQCEGRFGLRIHRLGDNRDALKDLDVSVLATK